MTLCPRCNCCEIDWEACPECDGEGYVSRYDEDPLWYSEDADWPCEMCMGQGGWNRCLGNCDVEGKHAVKAEGRAPGGKT